MIGQIGKGNGIMTDSAAVTVELFFDVSCPWCHGAIETTRRLLDELHADPAAARSLDVRWRFMRLHPMPSPEGVAVDPKHRDMVLDYTDSVGVRVDFDRYVHMYDPATAHRVLNVVRDDDGDDLPSLWSLARAIWSANFVDGIDITNLDALRERIAEAGLLLPDRIWQRAASDASMVALEADHARALEIDLDGVPRAYVNATIVPLWIDPDDIRTQLRAAISLEARTGSAAS